MAPISGPLGGGVPVFVSSKIVAESLFAVVLTSAFTAESIVKLKFSDTSLSASSTTVKLIAGAVVEPAGIRTLTPLSKKF